jgi:hypothetical protein
MPKAFFEMIQKVKWIRPADYVVIAVAIALLPLLYLQYWSRPSPGQAARIVDARGKEMIVPMTDNRRLEIEGPLGVSVIEIHDGAVRFVSSPCTAKLCIHAGWLRSGNDFTACLPNRVSVAVIGGPSGYDSVVF